jgi:thiol:disulfide interchange protein DsbD
VLLAVGFIVLGGLFAVGLAQPERESWLVDQLVAFAPARLNDEQFDLDFDDAVATASVTNDKPIFIDFTGVFCTNCRLMEKRMAEPENRRRLDNLILTKLYTDKVPEIQDQAKAKKLLERNVDLQIHWFGDVTLPSYAVVTPDGKTILSKYVGLEARTGEFAKFLDDGIKKWKAIRPQKL